MSYSLLVLSFFPFLSFPFILIRVRVRKDKESVMKQSIIGLLIMNPMKPKGELVLLSLFTALMILEFLPVAGSGASNKLSQRKVFFMKYIYSLARSAILVLHYIIVMNPCKWLPFGYIRTATLIRICFLFKS
jgi:hypothetical protein